MDIEDLREFLHRLDVAIRKLRAEGEGAGPDLRQEAEDLLDEACAFQDRDREKGKRLTPEEMMEHLPLSAFGDVLYRELLRAIFREDHYKKELTRPISQLIEHLKIFQDEMSLWDKDRPSKGPA